MKKLGEYMKQNLFSKIAILIVSFFAVNCWATGKRFSQTVPCNIIDEGAAACYNKAVGLQKIEITKLLQDLKQKQAFSGTNSYTAIGIDAIETQLKSLKSYCEVVGRSNSAAAATSVQHKNLEYINRISFEALKCECDALDDVIEKARLLNSAI